MRMKDTSFIACLILLTILHGCAQKHLATDNKLSHSTPVTRSSPAQSAQFSPAQPCPSSKLETQHYAERKPYPHGKHPVFYKQLLIGGMQNGTFTEFSLSAITDVLMYNCYIQHQFYKRLYVRSWTDSDFGNFINLQDKPLVPGKKPIIYANDEPPAEEKLIDAHWDVAIAGEWNAVPRKPRSGELADACVAQAIQAELARQNISKPGKVVGKVLIVDLAGDGSEEMIVEANSHDWLHQNSPEETAAYNCILLLQQQQQQWHASLIAGFFPAETNSREQTVMELQGIYDIDGDGWMEIICHEFIPDTDAFDYIAYRVKRVGNELMAEKMGRINSRR